MYKDYIEKWKGWLTLFIIIVLIVPSYYSISNYFLSLLLLFSPLFFQKGAIVKHKWPITVTFITVIINLVYYRNELFCLNCEIDFGRIIPIPLLLLLSSFIGFYFKNSRGLIVVFTVLFSLEAFVGIVEFIFGVQSFFIENRELIETPKKYFLSQSGVFGLSAGSSSFGVNMLCLIFLGNIYFSKKVKGVLILIGILGVTLSLNKTIVIGALVYLIISFLFSKHYNKIKYLLILLIVITNGVLLYFVFYPVPTINIVLTGRLPIYEAFVNFIRENVLFGNYFSPLRIIANSGKIIHSHNSLLQLLTENGLVYTLLFLSFLFLHIDKKNFLVISILFFISSTQYILFWGVYHIDVLFFVFLYTSGIKDQKILSLSNFKN